MQLKTFNWSLLSIFLIRKKVKENNAYSSTSETKQEESNRTFKPQSSLMLDPNQYEQKKLEPQSSLNYNPGEFGGVKTTSKFGPKAEEPKEIMNIDDKLEYYESHSEDLFQVLNDFITEPERFIPYVSALKAIDEYNVGKAILEELENIIKKYIQSKRKRKILARNEALHNECIQVIEEKQRDSHMWDRLANSEVRGVSEAIFFEAYNVFSGEKETGLMVLLAKNIASTRRFLLEEYFNYATVIVYPENGPHQKRTSIFLVRKIPFVTELQGKIDYLDQVESGYFRSEEGKRTYYLTLNDGSKRTFTE